jgi:hypothetical protein
METALCQERIGGLRGGDVYRGKVIFTQAQIDPAVLGDGRWLKVGRALLALFYN